MNKILQGQEMSLGCVMIDIEHTKLQPHEELNLLNPLIAGVILFSRNYESIAQITQLCQQIHSLRHPKLLIAVDHEGGRVQRFRSGFTKIPPMAKLGDLYNQNRQQALSLAYDIGWLIGTELLAVGIDFSFTPVVDLDYGDSRVIGDRALHSQPQVVSQLAYQIMQGLNDSGMASVAKHFPGHGYIREDTHVEIALDNRDLETIIEKDMQPFINLVNNNIHAIMPAHVRYPQVDDLPAGFSKHWLQKILREKLKFDGVIVSDDLSMQAATVYGDITSRVELALNAGCDLVLVCNSPKGAEQVLNQVKIKKDNLSHARLIRMHGKAKLQYKNLETNKDWFRRHKNILNIPV